MVAHTNYQVGEVSEKIVGEWYVRQDEALEKKVAHEVVTSLDGLI